MFLMVNGPTLCVFIYLHKHNFCAILKCALPFFQMNEVRDNACLKEADLQGRFVRKWTYFNMFMKATTLEQHGVWFGSEGGMC